MLNEAGRETRLVDNHTINEPVFRVVNADGETPLGDVVWGQIDQVREAVLHVLEHVSPSDWSFVFTNVVFHEPEDLAWIDRYAAVAAARGSGFLAVKLELDAEENARRIGLPGRAERQKMTSVPGLLELRANRTLAQPDRHPILQVNVTQVPPKVAAERILNH